MLIIENSFEEIKLCKKSIEMFFSFYLVSTWTFSKTKFELVPLTSSSISVGRNKLHRLN